MQTNMKKKQAVIAVSGVKNSGKTTLIERLIPYLQYYGLQVAVIKHDGHSFQADPSDTDTGRFVQAGAIGTAIYDGEKYKLIKYAEIDAADLIQLFPEADIILLEGFKHSCWKKVEIVRRGNSEEAVCASETMLALVTDLPLESNIPVIDLDDVAKVAELIIQYWEQL